MAQKVNYQLALDKLLADFARRELPAKVLLQSCCAPCSSYVVEYLHDKMDLTLFYYNPNIFPEEEFRLRFDEVARLLREMPLKNEVGLLEGKYDPQRFFDMAQGLEDVPEGGARCAKCFELRLRETALKAKELGFEYFGTTLTISPLKNAALINEIGLEIARETGVEWLPSDFKKRGGYQRSIELSRQYGLYRQNFCGCVFSAAHSRQQQG